MSRNYYIADLHFGHMNILSYDNRPFTDIKAHDKALIDLWNERITSDDDVYILGDVSWYPLNKTVDIIKSLEGRKHLIIGNHDNHFLKYEEFRNCFEEITPYKENKDCGRNIVLCHYPMLSFNGSYHGAWHFYAHVHISFEENMIQNYRRQLKDLYDRDFNMLNVGAMMPYIQYVPRTFEEIATMGTGIEELNLKLAAEEITSSGEK